MRILFINETEKMVGGAEQIIHSTMKLLDSNGHKVKLIATTDTLQTLKVFLRSFFSIRYFIKTLNAINEFNPDVIHVHNCSRYISPSPIFTAIFKNKKVVMTVHDFIYYCPRGWGINWKGEICREGFSLNCFFRNCNSPRKGKKNILLNFLKSIRILFHRYILKYFVKTFICPSTTLKKYLKRSLKLKEEKLVYLPNFIDMKVQENQKIEKKNNQFLFVGRLSKEKGIDVLIKAIEIAKKDCPKILVKIIGDGPERRNLENLTKKLNLQDNIKFLGRIPNEKLSQYYQESLALIMPSIWMENCPIVALEAMMNKTPIIASNIGGLPDLVGHNKNGYLFKMGDYKELASYIKKLYNNVEVSKKMGECGFKKVKREFSKERYYKKLTEIYKNVIKKE